MATAAAPAVPEGTVGKTVRSTRERWEFVKNGLGTTLWAGIAIIIGYLIWGLVALVLIAAGALVLVRKVDRAAIAYAIVLTLGVGAFLLMLPGLRDEPNLRFLPLMVAVSLAAWRYVHRSALLISWVAVIAGWALLHLIVGTSLLKVVNFVTDGQTVSLLVAAVIAIVLCTLVITVLKHCEGWGRAEKFVVGLIVLLPAGELLLQYAHFAITGGMVRYLCGPDVPYNQCHPTVADGYDVPLQFLRLVVLIAIGWFVWRQEAALRAQAEVEAKAEAEALAQAQAEAEAAAEAEKEPEEEVDEFEALFSELSAAQRELLELLYEEGKQQSVLTKQFNWSAMALQKLEISKEELEEADLEPDTYYVFAYERLIRELRPLARHTGYITSSKLKEAGVRRALLDELGITPKDLKHDEEAQAQAEAEAMAEMEEDEFGKLFHELLYEQQQLFWALLDEDKQRPVLTKRGTWNLNVLRKLGISKDEMAKVGFGPEEYTWFAREIALQQFVYKLSPDVPPTFAPDFRLELLEELGITQEDIDAYFEEPDENEQ